MVQVGQHCSHSIIIIKAHSGNTTQTFACVINMYMCILLHTLVVLYIYMHGVHKYVHVLTYRYIHTLHVHDHVQRRLALKICIKRYGQRIAYRAFFTLLFLASFPVSVSIRCRSLSCTQSIVKVQLRHPQNNIYTPKIHAIYNTCTYMHTHIIIILQVYIHLTKKQDWPFQ